MRSSLIEYDQISLMMLLQSRDPSESSLPQDYLCILVDEDESQVVDDGSRGPTLTYLLCEIHRNTATLLDSAPLAPSRVYRELVLSSPSVRVVTRDAWSGASTERTVAPSEIAPELLPQA